MSARATNVDISVLTIGGINEISYAVSGSITKTAETDAGRAINRLYQSPQIFKKAWSFDAEILSTVSGANRVTNQDLTVYEFGGTDFIAHVESMNLNWSGETQEGSGVSDEWRYPNLVGGSFSGSAVLKVATAAVPIMAALDAIADHDGTLDFTLNGVDHTLPVLITSAVHRFSQGDIQRVEIAFEGQDPLSGTYPTAPSGTTSLQEKVFNAPATALAVAFTSKAVGGVAYTGNAIPTSYGLTVPEGGVIRETISLAGVGALTDAATV